MRNMSNRTTRKFKFFKIKYGNQIFHSVYQEKILHKEKSIQKLINQLSDEKQYPFLIYPKEKHFAPRLKKSLNL